MSSLQRRVARAQTKGDMIKAVDELRQAAQMWKSLYDEQTVTMAKMGEEFSETYERAMQEIDMTKAITYMMLWNTPDLKIRVQADQIDAFNKQSERDDGSWDLQIDGDDEVGFEITLEWVGVVEDGEAPDPKGEDNEETFEEGEQDTPDTEEEVIDAGSEDSVEVLRTTDYQPSNIDGEPAVDRESDEG